MNFERSDGVIVCVLEKDDGFEFRLIDTVPNSDLTPKPMFRQHFNLSQVLESSDLPPERGLHEHCSRVARCFTTRNTSTTERPGDHSEECLLVSEPKFVESSSLDQLIISNSKSMPRNIQNDEVAKKRVAAIDHIMSLRNTRALQRHRGSKSAIEKALLERDSLDKQKEIMYRESQTRNLFRTENRRALERIRDETITAKLKQRVLGGKMRIFEMISRAKNDELKRSGLVAKWKQDALARKIRDRPSNSNKSHIDKKRDINIQLRTERERLHNKQYVIQLNEQRKQIERKKKILLEKRRAHAFELFQRPV